jgi:glycosyltransferase involved in cell wall biosynthesis
MDALGQLEGKPMRVLIFTQYFAPEVTAARARIQPIAERLAASGHEVEVVCEVPNHPEGIVRDGYGGRPLIRRRMDGYGVRYVWVRTSPVKTTWSRLALYGTYAAAAALFGSLGPRPDVIMVSSPPLPAALGAALVAKRFRCPWVFDVRDLWPEAAVALGELTDPKVIGILEWLEHRLYRDADAIVTVTEPFRADIAAKVDDPDKITIVPNGTTRAWMRAGEVDVDRAELDMPADKFIWTYAGNLGIAQGLGAAIEAAARLGEGYQLQLVGTGPLRGALEAQAARLPVGTVVFRGLVQPDVAARYLRASDANLVSLGAQPELSKFVPSKLFDYCALGRPVILAAAGEPQRLAAAADAAIPIPPEDPDALVAALRKLHDQPALGRELGERGRGFAAQYLREVHVERLEAVLAGTA